MKKFIFLFISFSIILSVSAQEKTPVFKKGEWLRYKMSYSGFLKAGNATLTVDTDTIDGKEVFHVVGKGWTTGLIKLFFKVKDTYESYFDKETIKPYLFKRNIYEGGYTINRKIKFDYNTNKATIHDYKHKTTNHVEIGNIQDMMSSFYYLRTHDVSKLKPGEEIALDMFFDAQTYPFKLRFLGEEFLHSRFGKIKTLKFKPLVQSGRVFKENESVTIWVTADENKIPVKLKASLAVGSLKAELDAYKGLANSFQIIYD